MTITADPLTWPVGWKRTDERFRIRARFSSKSSGYGQRAKTIAEGGEFALAQLRIMGVDREDIIISTNLRLRLDGLPYSSQRDPDDPGAAIWWRPYNTMTGHRVIAIDLYDRVADNLYAIGKTLEAMRGIERWGGGEILERTFVGFAALPAPEGAVRDETWAYNLIGATGCETTAELIMLWRKALSKAHPDHGGTNDQFHDVRNAGEIIGISEATGI